MDETEDLEAKLTHCEEMIQNNPTLASGYSEKGGLLLDLKRYEEALAAFEKAYQLDPSDSSIQDLITQTKRYQSRKLLRKTRRLYSEFWRIHKAIRLVAVGFALAVLALRINLFVAIDIAVLTIGATLILLLKTFRPVKRVESRQTL